MKKIKKILCGFCAAVLCLQGVGTHSILTGNNIIASAETGIYDNMLLYSVESGEVSITGSLENVDNSLDVPSEIDGIPVVRITGTAFTNCTGIRSVSIPASVTEIESGAFAKCVNLTEIIVDEANSAYTSVNGILLDKTGTRLLRCPGGITSETFAFPGTVTEIADTAFQSCINLTNITVPDTVSVMGRSVFSGCTALNSV